METVNSFLDNYNIHILNNFLYENNSKYFLQKIINIIFVKMNCIFQYMKYN